MHARTLSLRVIFTIRQSAFKKHAIIYGCSLSAHTIVNVQALFAIIKQPLFHQMKAIGTERMDRFFNIGCITLAQFDKYDLEGNITDTAIIPLRTKAMSFVNKTDKFISRSIVFFRNETIKRADQVITSGSGWVFSGVQAFHMEVTPLKLFGACEDENKYLPIVRNLKGNQYLTILPNKNKLCFFTAMACGLLDRGGHDTVQMYMDKIQLYIHKFFKIKKISLPVSIKEVKKFESLHKHLSFGINVYFFEKKLNNVHVLYRSKRQDVEKKVNLLLIPTMDENKYHYLHIRDLNKFFRVRANISSIFICDNCLAEKSTAISLKTHRALCLNKEAQTIILPPEGTRTTFYAFSKKCKAEIIGVVDFEAVQDYNTTSENKAKFGCDKCVQDGLPTIQNCIHGSYVLSKHQPVMYVMLFLNHQDKIIFKRVRCSDNAEELLDQFYTDLEEAQSLCIQLLNRYPYFCRSKETDKLYREASVCYLCDLPFDENDYTLKKVRDHSHSDKDLYLGAAHSLCNINRRRLSKIPIFAHNLFGYDINFLLKYYTDYKKRHGHDAVFKAIPLNNEKFR
jgi:hypothetical protein